MLDFVDKFASGSKLDTVQMRREIERFNVTLEVSFTPHDRIYGAYLAMNGENDHNQTVQEMLNITASMRREVELIGGGGDGGSSADGTDDERDSNGIDAAVRKGEDGDSTL